MSTLNSARGGAFFLSTAARALSIAAVVGFELVVLDSLYDVHALAGYAATDAWLWTNALLKCLAYAGIYAAGAFTLMAWPKRRLLWTETAGVHRWLLWLALNLTAFIGLAALLLVTREHAHGPPWSAFALTIAAAALMLGCGAVSFSSLASWRTFATRFPTELIAAGCAGAAIMVASQMAQNSWNVLAGVTLRLSYAVLKLFDSTAFIDVNARELGAGNYKVIVDSFCSGYEGVGLVLSALALFLWLFRAHLRFPRALFLLPLGASLIWLLNGVRIAAMVEIGAHVSRGAALHGFHSQAGWILFVAVTIALMAWAHSSAFFRADAPERTQNPVVGLASAMLLPFAALMAARTIAAAFGADAYWIAASAIALPVAVLWFYRDTLLSLLSKINLGAVTVGVAVGAIWIVTEPAHPSAPLASWLAQQSPSAAFAWLALRVLGFALIVPIAEELLFRGYLHQALSARRFEDAKPAFNWVAFISTSLLFGLMHQRWLAGLLAGAAYALVLYRSKNLSGPIAAHVASNGLIAAYALVFANWNLI